MMDKELSRRFLPVVSKFRSPSGIHHSEKGECDFLRVIL